MGVRPGQVSARGTKKFHQSMDMIGGKAEMRRTGEGGRPAYKNINDGSPLTPALDYPNTKNLKMASYPDFYSDEVSGEGFFFMERRAKRGAKRHCLVNSHSAV